MPGCAVLGSVVWRQKIFRGCLPALRSCAFNICAIWIRMRFLACPLITTTTALLICCDPTPAFQSQKWGFVLKPGYFFPARLLACAVNKFSSGCAVVADHVWYISYSTSVQQTSVQQCPGVSKYSSASITESRIRFPFCPTPYLFVSSKP
jgi:hypothetical protein